MLVNFKPPEDTYTKEQEIKPNTVYFDRENVC